MRRLLGAIAPALRAGHWWVWLVAVIPAIAHGWALWVGMGGWQGISQPWPLARHDHPLHFHGAVNTRTYFAISGTNAGYDPSFMSGYAASSIPNTSTTLVGVAVALFGAKDPVLVYKLYVWAAAALAPWMLVGAGRHWGMGPGAVGVSVALFVVYLWTDFPINYVEFGMVAYFLGIPLGLLSTAALTRYLESGGGLRWLAAALGSSLLLLVHVTGAMVAAPAAGLAYLAALRGARRGGGEDRGRFPVARHVGFWCVAPVALAMNAFWWLPVVWLAGTKGEWDPSFTHPESVARRLWQIVSTEAPVESVLWAGAPVGLIALGRRRPVAAAGLGAYLGAGLFWGYLAGAFRALDPLQPGRHTYALYAGAALAAGLGAAELAAIARAAGPGRLDRWLAVGAVLVGLRFFGPALDASVRGRVAGPEPFLSSRPTTRLRRLVEDVKAHVKPGERLLYEEGGKDRPGYPDVFRGDRYSGLLPYLTGVEMLGGPFLRVLVKENFTQFGMGILFGEEDWGRDHFERYARLYRPSAIACWSPHARAFCRANPDLVDVLDDDGLILFGRVKGFGGGAVVGAAEVEATPGRLHVRGATGGVDGTVVLRYHSVPCLRARPAIAWDSVQLERDPVPFIRLRPPIGRDGVTLELGFPPPAREPPGDGVGNGNGVGR